MVRSKETASLRNYFIRGRVQTVIPAAALFLLFTLFPLHIQMSIEIKSYIFRFTPGMVHSLWAYRGFILGSVKREFQSRYKGSLLGASWAVISPLSMIFVYLVVFSQVMSAKLPGLNDTMGYGLFLCAGIFTWGYFVEVVNRSIDVFIEHANLLKKSPIPRASLPLIVLLSATLNFIIVFSLFMLFLVATSRFPGSAILALLPLLLIQQTFAVGLGVILGTLNVFYRDVGQMMGIVLQFWFWLTPIVYPPSILPEYIRKLLETWNPLARLISGYQNIILTGQWPDPADFLAPSLLAIISLVLGYVLFKRLSGEMVDEL